MTEILIYKQAYVPATYSYGAVALLSAASRNLLGIETVDDVDNDADNGKLFRTVDCCIKL